MINGTAITIGKFDGFHLGHQVLLNDISEKAGEKNLEAVCCKLRFSGCNIMSTNEEDSFLKNRFPKIDRIEYIDFTPEFAAMSPDEFVRDYLVQRLSVAYVVVGNDFRFGKDRAGDAETLKSLGKKYGFEVRICDKLLIDGSVVSSTRVRENLAKGNVENASRLLGYTYELNGTVTSGKKLGRTFGFPTINLGIEQDKLLFVWLIDTAGSGNALCGHCCNFDLSKLDPVAHVLDLEVFSRNIVQNAIFIVRYLW